MPNLLSLSTLPLVLVVLLAALPAAAGIAALLRDSIHHRPYLPIGDHAILELDVRRLFSEPVLDGPYSRFGWHHPGPLEYWLLSVPYWLSGQSHESLAVGAAVINGTALAGLVLVLHRVRGLVVGLAGLAITSIYLRLLPGFAIDDPWNPILPVLPFVVSILLCWYGLNGHKWAFPVVVVLISFAVQSHVGYLVPGLLVLAATAAMLGVRVARQPQKRAFLRRQVRVVTVTSAALLLVWLPPLIQQTTGRKGNLSSIWEYATTSRSDSSLSVGLRVLGDELGKLPTYLSGTKTPDALLLPERYPTWSALATAALWSLALLVALRRRDRAALTLAALSAAVCAGTVIAVARVQGQLFSYVTAWTSAAGITAWLFIVVAAAPVAVAATARLSGSRRRLTQASLRIGAAVLAAAAVGLLTIDTWRTVVPQTDTDGAASAVAAAVRADSERSGHHALLIQFASSTDKGRVSGTPFFGSGVVLALVREHANVQVDPSYQLLFRESLTSRAAAADYVATIAFSDGSSPPPAPWQRLLARQGDYQVYGGVPDGR